MEFQQQFLSRLEALPDRVAGEFPVTELPPAVRRAGVLLPFWPEADGSVRVAFTLRTRGLPSHQGQVSFPGGGMQPGDRDTRETALRETREETGIDPNGIRIMGRLDDAWSRYGFHIIPWVGWLASRPAFSPDGAEVEQILIADVRELLSPGAQRVHTHESAGIHRSSPAFVWEGGYVWGLTADILLELLLWVREEPSHRAGARLEWLQRTRTVT